MDKRNLDYNYIDIDDLNRLQCISANSKFFQFVKYSVSRLGKKLPY